MVLPPRLSKELQSLDSPPEVVVEGHLVSLVFRNYPIPPGYSRPTTDLLVRVPLSYPDAGPDMFWTDPDLRLIDGGSPQCGDLIETYLGKPWRRFSWHSAWRPATDSLESYLYFIRLRLERAC
jgi:hypothetical protein